MHSSLPSVHSGMKDADILRVSKVAIIMGKQDIPVSDQIDMESVSHTAAAFFGLSEEGPEGQELSGILEKLKECRFEHGQDICVINGESDCLYFLVSGMVQVLDGEGEQINLLREGQYFGEYGVITGAPRLSTVRSLGHSVLFRMDRKDVLKVLVRHPALYGEFMKRVYGQVSGKHRQILELSRTRRGILRHPSNREIMSRRQMLFYYGAIFLVCALCVMVVPAGSRGPVFLLPIFLMLVCVLVSKRTVESLCAGILLAILLLYRNNPFVGFTDAFLDTAGSYENVFTVFVMVLMGGVTALLEASGAVTSFKKFADRKVKSRSGALLLCSGIMAATAIDEGFNMLCGSFSAGEAADRQKVPRENVAALCSILPVILCSLMPVSLWSVFVFGTLAASAEDNAAGLLLHSMPFNYYSILGLVVMLLFCGGWLPLSKPLREAKKRVESGGELWPAGSDDYLDREEPDRWGSAWNVLFSIAFLGIASVTFRSFGTGKITLDSACALTATVVFLFFLYGFQGIMSPEAFLDNLCKGIAGSVLPVILYHMTICLSSLLDKLGLERFMERWAAGWSIVPAAGPLFPAALFLFAVLLTVLLGSSWAMFAMVFPIAVHLAPFLGMNPALCVGAVCAAGVAGEQNCLFTEIDTDVGNAVGLSPAKVLDVRLSLSIPLTIAAFLLYLAAGFLLR